MGLNAEFKSFSHLASCCSYLTYKFESKWI
jgi:hypothetical protein